VDSCVYQYVKLPQWTLVYTSLYTHIYIYIHTHHSGLLCIPWWATVYMYPVYTAHTTVDSSVYQSRGGYINHPFLCVPLVDTASDPALKATDAPAAASTEASDKQHKKASPPPTPHPLVSTTTTTISTAYPLYPTMSLAFIPSLCTRPGSTSTWSGTLNSMNHMNLCLDHASVMPDHRPTTARTLNPDNEIAQCFPSQH